MTGRHKQASDARREGESAAVAAGQGSMDTVERHERTAPEPQQEAPTVGKTGARGAKAERPSEGSDRKQTSAAPVEVTRGAKPPAETPKAGDRARRAESSESAK
jgi:hypothetical protein